MGSIEKNITVVLLTSTTVYETKERQDSKQLTRDEKILNAACNVKRILCI